MMCADVIVRSKDGAPSGWVHSLEAPRITEGIVRSERIDRIVAACDLLAAGDDAIAGASLRIVAGTTFVTPAAGEDVRHDVEARMPAASLAGVLGLNKQSHELLLSIDAFPNVRAAAQALADRVGVPIGAVLAKIIPAVRHALRAGVLEVAR